MHERVRSEAPNLTRPQDAGAIEKHEVEHGTATGGHDQTSQDRNHNMEGYQNGRDVDREPAHPRDRAIVIGGSYPEHISIIAFGFMSASDLANHRSDSRRSEV